MIPDVTIAKIISKKNNDIRCRSMCFANKAAQEKNNGENTVLMHGVFERKKREEVLRYSSPKRFFKARSVA